MVKPTLYTSLSPSLLNLYDLKKRAEDKLSQSGMDDKEVKLAEAKLHRALVRIGTVGK